MKNFSTILMISLFLPLCLLSQGWELVGESPFYSHHSNGFGIGDKAYLFNGSYDSDLVSSNEFWEYDASTNTWELLMFMPSPGRRVAIGDDWDGKYYYGFGSGDAGRLNDLWVFDPIDTSFTELPSCPCVGRTHPAFIAHNDKIYMGTGSTDDGDTNDWWEYDIETQVWTEKEDMPGGVRHHPFFFAEDNNLYVGGGHRTNWLKYNLDTETWSDIDDLPQGRVAGSQLYHNGLGLLIGGDDRFHDHVPDNESFMSYNIADETWNYLPPIPDGSKWAPSSFIAADALYFFGGISSNVNNDRRLWKFNLDFLDCSPAANLMTNGVTDVEANLFWTKNIEADSDTLKWRELGSPDWNAIPNAQATYTLSGLDFCQDYEFIVLTQCGDVITESKTFEFKTDGCCVNPEISSSEKTLNSITLDWQDILAAASYDLRWKAAEDTDWIEVSSTESNLLFSDLTECTEYEFQIKSICATDEVDFSPSFKFYTQGCGACLDQPYCEVDEDLNGEEGYISFVSIGSYTNLSGNNGGYGSFTTVDAQNIMLGETFQLNIDVSYEEFGLDLDVWIDFNGNGTFQITEKVVSEPFTESQVSREVYVPLDAAIGLTRMRIAYARTENFAGLPCDDEDIYAGEIEDYCLFIEGQSSTDDSDWTNAQNIRIYPNPSLDRINFASETNLEKANIVVSNILGERILSLKDFDFNQSLNVADFNDGIYFLSIEKDHKILSTLKFIKQN